MQQQPGHRQTLLFAAGEGAEAEVLRLEGEKGRRKKATPEEAARRREEAHIPEDLPFRTKPQIAGELVRDVIVTGIVGLDWITAARRAI